MSELTQDVEREMNAAVQCLYIAVDKSIADDVFSRWIVYKASQRQRIAQLEAEVAVYRSGGVTEELLRRHDGFIKVGKGCVIVQDVDYAALKAEVARLRTAQLDETDPARVD